MAEGGRCNWCNDPYDRYVMFNGLAYCSNRCKHQAEKSFNENNPKEPTEKVKIVEKVVYIDSTSEAERDKIKASTEWYKQRARQIKREQDQIDADAQLAEEKSNKKWVILGLIVMLGVINWATFGEMVPCITGNIFILSYLVYYLFGNKLKKIGEWLDDKLN